MKQGYHWQNFKLLVQGRIDILMMSQQLLSLKLQNEEETKVGAKKKKKQDLGTMLLSENAVEAPSCFCCSTQFKKKRQEIVEN